jgi:signal transduction histidine kinase
MKRILFFLSLFVGLIVLFISIYGFMLLRQRPGLPEIKKSGKDSQIRVVKIDDIEIRNLKLDGEFILSQKTIGDKLTLILEADGELEKREVTLVPYYSQTPFPLIYLGIGLFCILTGVLVFLLRAEDTRARIYYWACLCFSSAIIISGGFYCLRKSWLSYLPGVLYYVFYPLAPALLLHFTLFFTKSQKKISRVIIYIPALLLILALEGLFFSASLYSSIEAHRVYQSVLYGQRIYLVIFVLLSFFSLIAGYRKAMLEEEKAQIKWIFYGLIVGLGPFILLYQLPQLFNINLQTEEITNIFFIFIPLAFAFSIVKFKLMDIELVINRSLVYFMLTIFTVSIYLLFVNFIQSVSSRFFTAHTTVVSVLAALAAAAAFHPARKRIQDFVDRAFFRMSYDYRKAILSFNEKAYKMVNRGQLLDFFLKKTKDTLPLESIGISIYAYDAGELKLLIARNGEKDLDSLAALSLDMDKVFAKGDAVRMEENLDFSQERRLRERNIEIIIPLSLKSSDMTGLLALGKKKSGERFTRDDLELLQSLVRDLALNLERIRLLEEVIYERVEREKLSELVRLKTEFISTVSHELRTPMSSIRGLAEILQAGKIKNKAKQGELINLVASESSRLSRFLHNILDFGKIEQNVKTYHFQKVAAQPLIQETVKLFQPRLDSERFVIETNLPEEPVSLEIDQDAVIQALTNLIDNAIKYSSEEKEIAVELAQKGKQVEIRVKDKGIGIPQEEQKRIFEGFHRHQEAIRHSPKGVGLGLKIIKHIMDAHRGEIRVESQPGEGSMFSLIFPVP